MSDEPYEGTKVYIDDSILWVTEKYETVGKLLRNAKRNNLMTGEDFITLERWPDRRRIAVRYDDVFKYEEVSGDAE